MDMKSFNILNLQVCIQVAEYYKGAARHIQASNERATLDSVGLGGGGGPETIADSVGDKKSKAWYKFVEFKRLYYLAVAYLYLGIQSDEAQRMGERVTYFQAASEHLEKAAKHSRNLDTSATDKSTVAAAIQFALGESIKLTC